jgi:transcriptional regulator with XRE-family HTH domain
MVGKRIKQRRSEIKMSLRALAIRVELTASFLSQVERDLTEPSLRSLRRIADALNVPLLYFLEEENTQPLVRRNHHKRLHLKDERVAYEVLTPDIKRRMDMFVVRLHPAEKNIAYPLAHPTEECILVLEGQLLVQLGDTEFILVTGDSIYFEGMRLKKMMAVGDEPAVFVSAITPAVF